MTDKTSLGDRMKRYEAVPLTSLTPRMPLIIRVDGRAFHTYTKRFKRKVESPWSPYIKDAMTAAAQALMREISGAKIAYIQSDEISVLATDYDSLSTQAWFDKVAQKVVSISAAIATAEFNQRMLAIEMSEQTVTAERPGQLTFTIEFPRLAAFDSRAFVVPRDDVTNYFVWRQRDATKNSIAMLAQKHFSPKQLHGKNGGMMQEMLHQEKGINWNDCEVWQKRGWCVTRKVVHKTVGELRKEEGRPAPTPEPGDAVEVIRAAIDPDWDIPIFTKDRDYVERYVNVDLDEDDDE